MRYSCLHVVPLGIDAKPVPHATQVGSGRDLLIMHDVRFVLAKEPFWTGCSTTICAGRSGTTAGLVAGVGTAPCGTP